MLAGADGETTRDIARRFGFTNPSRFAAVYAKRLARRHGDTRRRASSDTTLPLSVLRFAAGMRNVTSAIGHKYEILKLQ